jgi:PEP-CTERM motif
MKVTKPLVAAVVAAAGAMPAVAVEVVLDFEGIWGQETPTGVRPTPILDFYKDAQRTEYLAAGGVVGSGATGPVGAIFSSGAAGIRNSLAPAPPFGTQLAAQYVGNSSYGVLGFENRLLNTFTLNVPAGFTGDLSLQYSILDDVTVELLGQSGVVLDSDSLEHNQLPLTTSCQGAGVADFCSWADLTLSAGQQTAYSVRFTGVAGDGNGSKYFSLFDNFKFQMNGELPPGSASPAPEPSTYAMMALGLLGIGFATRRRMRQL